MSTENTLELEVSEEKPRAGRSRKAPESKDPKDLKKSKESSVKKIDPDAARLLRILVEKANKKDLGRKIRDSEVIMAGLEKLTSEDLQVLQDRSMRSKDRVELALLDYNKNNPKISMDEFLVKLLSGEIVVTRPSKA